MTKKRRGTDVEYYRTDQRGVFTSVHVTFGLSELSQVVWKKFGNNRPAWRRGGVSPTPVAGWYAGPVGVTQ